jgi:hypothetical protein
MRSDTKRAVTGVLVGDGVLADRTKFDAGTLFKLEIISTGAALGANFYKSTVTMLKCEVTDDPFHVESSGIIKSTIPFRALKPTAGDLIQHDIVNAESAVA